MTWRPQYHLCVQASGSYKGFLSATFAGTPGGSSGATCGKNDSWSWPVIDTVIVMGTGPVDGDSIVVQVRSLQAPQ